VSGSVVVRRESRENIEPTRRKEGKALKLVQLAMDTLGSWRSIQDGRSQEASSAAADVSGIARRLVVGRLRAGNCRIS
jgi:hypothetical protein